MKLEGEEVLRLRPLGVCSGTFHSNSPSRKPTFPKNLVADGTRVGHEEVLPPCGHFLQLQLDHWHLQFTRRKGLLMIAAARKGPMVGIADINSKHN